MTEVVEPIYERALAVLRSGGAFGGLMPEEHTTHAARVFVARGVALKIKRPVSYGYLDFSTVEKRRAALERELALNRPHAPAIYRDVVAITEDDGGTLTLGGNGRPVEWVLRMAAFEQADILANRIAQGPLPDTTVKALAEVIARSHAQAPPVGGGSSAGSLERVRASLAEGLGQLPQAFDRAAVEAWSTAAKTSLANANEVLDRRQRAGFMRRCHGDLHLANIVLREGAPVLFDALEFDEALATIDTLYDFAFLIMDFDARGHRSEANLLLGQYLWASRAREDLEGLIALPVMLSLRAGIRALVTAQRAFAQQDGAGRSGGEPERSAWQRYFTAAADYLAPAPVRLVAVGGFSGTGKSTLARRLAPQLGRAPGAVHLRSDLERKAIFDVSETERLPPAAYDLAATKAVYARLEDRAGAALAAGHSVIVDAVFSTPEERAAIAAVADGAGASFAGLWLTAPADILKARVGARTGDASDATTAVVDAQVTRGAGTVGWQEISAAGTQEDTLTAAEAALATTWG